MDPSLKAFIGNLSKEKDLDIDIIKDAIENALLSASKKNLSQFRDARPEAAEFQQSVGGVPHL